MTISLGLYCLICAGLWVLGCFAGRFLNRCVLRLPQHFYVGPAWRHVWEVEPRKGLYPAIRWYHWLPVIGTASIVGRSPYSGRRVLKREPWLELLNGFLFVLAFLCCLPPAEWGGAGAATVISQLWAGNLFQWSEPPSLLFLWGRYLYFLLLVEALFVATFIDFDLWIIPDGVTIPGMVIGFVGQVLGVGFYLAPLWLQDPDLVRFSQQMFPVMNYWPVAGWYPDWILAHPVWHAVSVSVAGFLVGGGIVWAVRIIGGVVLQKEAMGFGDVILMAMIGCFVGWQAVVVVFFVAPVMALFVLFLISLLRFLSLVKLPPELPYGPYLSLATVVVLFGWRFLWPYLERIFLMGPLLILLAFVMLVLLASTLLLLQGLKWLLGITPWPEEEPGWRSLDQLMYLMGEKVDLQQGNWHQSQWQGIEAGRGQLPAKQWLKR